MRWSVPVKRMMKARTPGQIQMFFISFVYLLHEKFHIVMISIRLFQVLTISPFILLIMTTAARPVFTDPSVFLDRLIAPGTTPVYSNKICVETIRHIAAGTSAYRTSRSGEVGRSLVMEITLHTTIIFPYTTDLFVGITFTIGISR